MRLVIYFTFLFLKVGISIQSNCICVFRSNQYNCRENDRFSFIDKYFRKKYAIYAIKLGGAKSLSINKCLEIDLQHILYSPNVDHISIQNIDKLNSINHVSDFYRLSRLELINNNIEFIPILTKLTNLWRVDMSHNLISNLNHSKFFPLSVEYIFLQYNNISFISENCFSLLRNLIEVNLGYNRLYDLSLEFNIETLGNFNLYLTSNKYLADFRKITINSKYKTSINIEAWDTVMKNLPFFNITHKNAAYELKPLLRIHKYCKQGNDCIFTSEFYLHCYVEF